MSGPTLCRRATGRWPLEWSTRGAADAWGSECSLVITHRYGVGLQAQHRNWWTRRLADVTPSPIYLRHGLTGSKPMDTEIENEDVRMHARQARPGTDAELALHERLLISALVAGVNLWIRIAEVTP